MAFFRGPQSPRDEPFAPNSLSPPQRNPNRWSASMAGTGDVRGALQRRFTTNTVPTLSPIGQQRRQAAGDVQMPSAQHRITPSERAARHYEQLLQAQRKIQEELEKVDVNTRREVDENIRHEQSVTQLFAQSEPTTPPEYNAFPSAFSRPNRYSAASLTSPAGISTRPNRSSTQLTSPSAGFARTYNSNSNANGSNIPSQSVPGSRRQSDGEEDDDDDFIYGYDDSVRRAAANPNRNSMPITSYDRKRNTADLSLGHMSVAGFVFDDNEKSPHQSKSNKTSPPDLKTYLQVQHTADGFPKLIRREENGDLSLSAVSAALDLASPAQDSQSMQVADRAAATRHRISLPPSALGGSVNIAPLNGILANANENRSNNRRSMEVKFAAETKRPALLTTPPRGYPNGSTMSSYSTNDLPTLKSINGDEQNLNGGVSLRSPPSQTASITSGHATASLTSGHASPEQITSYLNHLSLNRQSQDFGLNNSNKNEGQDSYPQAQGHSVLQASAPSFGPSMHDHNQAPGPASPPMAVYAQSPYYGGYAMQMPNPAYGNINVAPPGGFHNMNIGAANGFNPQAQWPAQVGAAYPQSQPHHGQHQGFPVPFAAASRFDNARANPMQRRQAAEEAQARFQSIRIDQLVGEIYSLCKDQHGCRFLQRKLEERDPDTIQTIFNEVHTHMVELMVDPFGNYLCQKLLESTNDEQRTALIKNASPAMTSIAVNQHGTRALQKMIEYISTPEQTALIIEALRNDVVMLIQDLNGNHVIQKCLNHLSSTDAIFIFEAVGANCITVGTHRHGCCVLQRCIDHADGLQKGRMVDHVIRNAYALVQDPFGNYVVQYILDLAEPCFTEPLCKVFVGELLTLSRQKFSSNVIEKCIRCAEGSIRRDFITEIMHPQNIEKLLRDGFANYVVQTAMDNAGDLKPMLVENIRMVLPSIRNTPHGRRIQSKIADYDSHNPNSPTTLPPPDMASPVSYVPVQQASGSSRANRQGMVGAPPNWSSSAVEGYTSLQNGGDYGTGTTNGMANGTANAATNGFSNVFSNEAIASPAPQRSSFSIFNNAQNYQTMNGGQEFQANGGSPNYQVNSFGSPSFAGRQPYGHF